MDSYWLNLLTAAIGVLVSPLGVIAVVVVLLSQRPRANSIAFLAGWVIGIVGALAIGLLVIEAVVDDAPTEVPTWVNWLRIIIGLVLIVGGIYSYVRGRHHLRLMAAAATPTDIVEAAPQLPGWLRAVETFTPGRSLLLGIGLCVLNPVDLSFILLAAITVSNATPTSGSWIVGAVLFVILGAASVAAPVVYYLVRGKRADASLNKLRTWIAANSTVLNTAVLVGFGLMQFVKGARAL